MDISKRPNPWDAQGIYVRLSRERKKHLLAIAQETGHLESPIRALAAHISAAGAAIVAKADNPFLETEDHGDSLWNALFLRLDRVAAALADLTDRVTQSNPVEARKATAAFNADLAINSLTPRRPLGQWLSEVAASDKGDAPPSILALANWKAAYPSFARSSLVDLAFQAEVLSIDGRPAEPSLIETVYILAIPPSSPIANYSSIGTREMVFACQLDGSAWSVSAYALGEDGGLGRQIATTISPA